MNHDNPMTIGFVGDEMTLKATLFICATCFEERLRPLMTSMGIIVLFFTKIIYVVALAPC
jgi:hypothetical protein